MLFAGTAVMALAIGCLVMLPMMRLGSYLSYGVDRPVLDLPVADHAWRSSHRRNVIEISLDWQNRWVTRGQGRVENLEEFLAECAKIFEEQGYVPDLRLRVAGDAPARYFLNAAMLAEELEYGRLHVAVHAPE